MVQHRRSEDTSAIIWLRDKVLPPVIIAGILGGFAGGAAVYHKIGQVTESIPKINAELARLNDRQIAADNRITVIESQMVGWDVLKRIEMSMNSPSGKDKAMQAISSVLRSEIEARKEKPQNDRR